MESYKPENYEVFRVKMTVDKNAEVDSSSYISNCRSCQCQCHLCRGRAPTSEVKFSQIDTEKALEMLLAA